MKKTFVTAILSVGLLTGCNNPLAPKDTEKQNDPVKSSETNQQDAMPTVDDSDFPTYIVAMVNTYPPFATTDEHGLVTGIDVDIIKAIAKEQKFKPQFLTHSWDSWETDLTSGKADIWASGITIKDKRKKIALYSDPYMTYNTAFLTRGDGNSISLTEGNTLQGHPLGAESNSTSLEIAKTLNTNPDQVKDFKSNFLAFESLQQKKIDAVIGNNIVLANISTSFPEYNFTLQNLPDEVTPSKQLGFLVKKDRNELTEELNSGLKSIKANGEFDKIQEKWLGTLIE